MDEGLFLFIDLINSNSVLLISCYDLSKMNHRSVFDIIIDTE